MSVSRLLSGFFAALLLTVGTAGAATWTTIDVPGSFSTSVQGLNSSGEMVGYFSDGQTFHCFTLISGTFTTMDAPGSTATLCTGINDSGQISGYYTDDTEIVT